MSRAGGNRNLRNHNAIAVAVTATPRIRVSQLRLDLTVCRCALNDLRVIYGAAMPYDEPKWRRRKEARPREIVEAALTVFAEKGFAVAKLDDIARRAGIAKPTLYLYFETKEDLFRAVARSAVTSLLGAIESSAEAFDAPFAELAPRLLSRGRDDER